MTLKEYFKTDWEYQNETMVRIAQTQAAVVALGLQDCRGCTYQGSFEVYARDAEHAAEIAKTILPKVGRLDKVVNQYSGSLELTAQYLDVGITIRYSPPAGCTIQEVTEEVTEPARTYTRRKFVAVGDCAPLLGK
jgi:hypothetical protein